MAENSSIETRTSKLYQPIGRFQFQYFSLTSRNIRIHGTCPLSSSDHGSRMFVVSRNVIDKCG
jgi:hypothetical protein